MRAAARTATGWLPAALALALSLPSVATTLSDPTAPRLRAAGAGTPPVEGQGLSWTRVTENRREAVINGVRVVEGQQLGAMRIHAIRHGEVVVEQADRFTTLQVQPAGIKKRHP